MSPPSSQHTVPEVSAHDAVLALIPASLLAATLGALAFPLSFATALALGSVPATGSIGYALFLDPPTVSQ